jgi:hypothetical protein
MTTSRSHDRQTIALLEDTICDRELALTLKLAGGVGTATEEAALVELYRTLLVAHHLQAHRANLPFKMLRRLNATDVVAMAATRRPGNVYRTSALTGRSCGTSKSIYNLTTSCARQKEPCGPTPDGGPSPARRCGYPTRLYWRS